MGDIRNFTMYPHIMCPCKDCANRHELCHKDCEAYRQYREEIKKTKDSMPIEW